MGGGGSSKKLIRLMKAVFYKTVGSGMLTWEELSEVLLDVEKSTAQSYGRRAITHAYAKLDVVLESKLSARVKATSPRSRQHEETSEVFETYEGRNVEALD